MIPRVISRDHYSTDSSAATTGCWKAPTNRIEKISTSTDSNIDELFLKAYSLHLLGNSLIELSSLLSCINLCSYSWKKTLVTSHLL
jgi:hypothetical protein